MLSTCIKLKLQKRHKVKKKLIVFYNAVNLRVYVRKGNFR